MTLTDAQVFSMIWYQNKAANFLPTLSKPKVFYETNIPEQNYRNYQRYIFLSEPPRSHLENTLLHLKGRRHISLFYISLMSYDKESTVDRLEARRLHIQKDIQEADWERVEKFF